MLEPDLVFQLLAALRSERKPMFHLLRPLWAQCKVALQVDALLLTAFRMPRTRFGCWHQDPKFLRWDTWAFSCNRFLHIFGRVHAVNNIAVADVGDWLLSVGLAFQVLARALAFGSLAAGTQGCVPTFGTTAVTFGPFGIGPNLNFRPFLQVCVKDMSGKTHPLGKVAKDGKRQAGPVTATNAKQIRNYL